MFRNEGIAQMAETPIVLLEQLKNPKKGADKK